MAADTFISDAAVELRAYGLWVVAGHEHLWAAHYFQRPNGTPTLTAPCDWEQPHWQVDFHGRLADVYGFPIDVALDTDPETGRSGAPNRSTAERHCNDDGYIFLGDFNGINRNVGYWTPQHAPTWRFANMIQNVIGGVDPDVVIRETNDLSEAYQWLKSYNECHAERPLKSEGDAPP